MKTRMGILWLAVMMLGLATTASAGVYTVAGPNNLGDLDHYYYYEWGINWNIPAGEKIVGAFLRFNDIRNWDNNPNDLYVHLLDSSFQGIKITWDNQGGGDSFAGQGILLNHWQNLSSTAQDITYNLDSAEIAVLTSYLSDGKFGLGFDPDCHFYNNGIKLKIVTTPVPEPGIMLLLVVGLAGVVGLKKLVK